MNIMIHESLFEFVTNYLFLQFICWMRKFVLFSIFTIQVTVQVSICRIFFCAPGKPYPKHYVWFSWFWSYLKMSKNVFWVVARLPQRLKSILFEIFSHSAQKGALHSKENSNNVDFSLWGKQCIIPWKWDQNCENHT